MPLYEYQCEACDARFERIQKYSDPLADTCPTCGGKVHKLLSSPAIKFKGSGWYITDYAKKSSSDPGKAGSSKDKSESPTSTSSSPDSSTSSTPSTSSKSSTDKKD
jgi:putative FmdB family regulatory protein